MSAVGKAQNITEEQAKNKFAETASIVKGDIPKPLEKGGRISPQVSCTVGMEEKKMLDELTLFASNKVGRIVNTSTVLRALIRLGNSKREELEF